MRTKISRSDRIWGRGGKVIPEWPSRLKQRTLSRSRKRSPAPGSRKLQRSGRTSGTISVDLGSDSEALVGEVPCGILQLDWPIHCFSGQRSEDGAGVAEHDPRPDGAADNLGQKLEPRNHREDGAECD
jgi:hypothetical protein